MKRPPTGALKAPEADLSAMFEPIQVGDLNHLQINDGTMCSKS